MTKKQTNKNTKVYVRFRPANELENDSNPWDVNDKRNYSCEVCEENEERARNKINVNDSYKIRTYTFDRAFSRYDSQVNVYRCTTSSLINNLLNGKNSSLMCYGQTGSGKTYTLFGFDERRKANDDKIDENDGIVARAVDDLFWKIRQTEKPGEVEYQIEVQFIQIYNEKVHDMLVPHQVDLPVRMVEEPLTGNLDWSAAATFVPVRNTYELMTQVQKGLKNRAVRLTSMNQSSSRSHAILKIRCRKLEINSGSVYTSVFDFVDLAGSEKVSNSLVLGAGFKEASYINVSLLHVKNVIKALSLLKKNKERPRVIYRNSVLTKLLYQTLGGNSESALILCASPHVYNLRETISTLRFGTMAKNVTSKPKVNYVMSIEELRKSNAVCIKRLEQQAIAIERKKKDVERNKILMFQILTKLNQNSQTYKEIKRRFGHWFPNLPENRVWGNLLLPDVVLIKVKSTYVHLSSDNGCIMLALCCSTYT